MMVFTNNNRLSINNFSYVPKLVPKNIKVAESVNSSVAIDECISTTSSTTSIYGGENNHENVSSTTCIYEENNCVNVDFYISAPESNKDEVKNSYYIEPEEEEDSKENVMTIKPKKEIPDYCEMKSQFCTKTAILKTIFCHMK